MSRRHDEADWTDRVARFVRSPRRVVLDGASYPYARRAANPQPQPKPETNPKEITP